MAPRRLRSALLALRWLAVLAPGYIHPDEFFQGPEPMSRDLLQLQATIPWEFAEKPPCRSVVSAALTSGVPLLGVRLLGQGLPSSWLGTAVLLAPRLWMVALSFTLDRAIVKLCEAFGLQSRAGPALLAFGSAWPALLMLSRPFSNSLEAVLLGAALIVSVGGGADRGGGGRTGAAAAGAAASCWRWFGLIGALGLFTRFTFVVFGAVLSGCMVVDSLGLAVLERTVRSFGGATSLQDQDRRRWRKLLVNICGGVVVFLAASAAIVLLDSVYFGTLSLTYRHDNTVEGETAAAAAAAASAVSPVTLVQYLLHGDADRKGAAAVVGSSVSGFGARLGRVGYTGHLTLTPLNSYRYNAEPTNLAKHGLHPRWTHAVVNMPMMFGPLAILGLLELCHYASRYAKPSDGAQPPPSAAAAAAATEERDDHLSPPPRGHLRVLCGSMVVLYLGGLSTAPHQEARFLLPLLLPMSILYGAQIFPPAADDDDDDAGDDDDDDDDDDHTQLDQQQQPTVGTIDTVTVAVGSDGRRKVASSSSSSSGSTFGSSRTGMRMHQRKGKDKGHLRSSPSPSPPLQRQRQPLRQQPLLLILSVWVAFNLTVAVFFGVLHQAGVAKALLSAGAERGLVLSQALPEDKAGFSNGDGSGGGGEGSCTDVVFFHTYMPPVALTAQDAAAEGVAAMVHVGEDDDGDRATSTISSTRRVLIHDLTSNSSIAALDETLHNLLMRSGDAHSTSGSADASPAGSRSHEYVCIVSPGSLDLGALLDDFYHGNPSGAEACATVDSGGSCEGGQQPQPRRLRLVREPSVGGWWPHLSMEDPPTAGQLIDCLLGRADASGLSLMLWRTTLTT